MKTLILLIIAMIIGAVFLINGGVTGYAVLEACPQPSWVYLNKPELLTVNDSVAEEVNNLFNKTAYSIKHFTKDSVDYYLASFINVASISECVTDLKVVCSCQHVSYDAS